MFQDKEVSRFVSLMWSMAPIGIAIAFSGLCGSFGFMLGFFIPLGLMFIDPIRFVDRQDFITQIRMINYLKNHKPVYHPDPYKLMDIYYLDGKTIIKVFRTGKQRKTRNFCIETEFTNVYNIEMGILPYFRNRKIWKALDEAATGYPTRL